MAIVKDSATFFQHGNSAQFEYVLGLYPKALRLKADTRGNGKKAEKLVRLEEWYQNELPKLIKKRGRDAHLLHEELVQTMEWKQTRGKFYPQLSYLIKINTPRAVVMDTRKAFRKLPNLEQALNALSNLKGVGITMASALLAAAMPESAPFMADECLMAIPDIEGIDYTTKEYLKFVTHIHQTMDRLNLEVESNGLPETSTDDGGGDDPPAAAVGTEKDTSDKKDDKPESSGEEATNDGEKTNGSTPAAADDNTAAGKPKAKKWSAHQVELALWTHYIVTDLQPELLGGMPGNNNGVASAAGGAANGISKEDGDEDDERDEDEDENGTADDDKEEDALGDEEDDENSRTAVESSESESNEAAGGGTAAGPVVVANGKARGSDEPDNSSANVVEEDALVAKKDTTPVSNNGTAEQQKSEVTVDGAPESEAVVPAPVTERKSTAESSPADGDECSKSGDSLDADSGAAVVATAMTTKPTVAATTTTLCGADEHTAADSGDSQNSSSHGGANKRPLFCEDAADDKPELSAPKLIKL
ncbi:uncharacterized protein LOC131210104 [Anopheles bellator]|uniref:uncharacterized protein LOC131210104 n=1 Tax=Anopheles bellator TaxID=139047 RepID=UPI0026493E2E|nr:uncharacterized protein LOC131210104 [Anopheles bellator]